MLNDLLRTFESDRKGVRKGYTSVKADVLCHFSGGKDSRLAIIKFVKENPHKKIILVTYNHGCNYYNKKVLISSQELMEKFENVIKHVVIDISTLFKELVIRNLERLTLKTGLLFTCIPCKLLMYSYSIMLCKKKFGCKDILVGDRKDNYYPEQLDNVNKLVKEFLNDYGINFIKPVYNLDSTVTEGDILNQLRYENINVKNNIQASCMFGGVWDSITPEKKFKLEEVTKDLINNEFKDWLKNNGI